MGVQIPPPTPSLSSSSASASPSPEPFPKTDLLTVFYQEVARGVAEGRSVHEITLQVTDYEHPPLPGNFEQVWVVRAFVDGRIDREGLVDELEDVLDGKPFTLDDRWDHFFWGADAAILQILIGLASGTGVVVVQKLGEAIARRARHHNSVDPLTGESAAASASEALARIQRVRPDLVTVDEVEPIKEGIPCTALGDRGDVHGRRRSRGGAAAAASSLGGTEDQASNCSGRLLLHRRDRMRIRVEGDPDARVTEDLGDDLRVNACGEVACHREAVSLGPAT